MISLPYTPTAGVAVYLHQCDLISLPYHRSVERAATSAQAGTSLKFLNPGTPNRAQRAFIEVSNQV